MIIKTKKYQLPTKVYTKIAFSSILKEQWWVSLIFIAICCGYFWIPSWWWIIGATIALALYMLFWYIQFVGVTQLEQSKFMFQKLSYEITSQQILMKLNAKQGMPIKWETVKRATVGKDDITLFLNKAQIVYFPHKIFNSTNEVKFIETILKRKGLVK